MDRLDDGGAAGGGGGGHSGERGDGRTRAGSAAASSGRGVAPAGRGGGAAGTGDEAGDRDRRFHGEGDTARRALARDGVGDGRSAGAAQLWRGPVGVDGWGV